MHRSCFLISPIFFQARAYSRICLIRGCLNSTASLNRMYRSRVSDRSSQTSSLSIMRSRLRLRIVFDVHLLALGYIACGSASPTGTAVQSHPSNALRRVGSERLSLTGMRHGQSWRSQITASPGGRPRQRRQRPLWMRATMLCLQRDT